MSAFIVNLNLYKAEDNIIPLSRCRRGHAGKGLADW
ncbi:uncharacterized protein METZ01_LOCUS293092, partial [marine metagenome]